MKTPNYIQEYLTNDIHLSAATLSLTIGALISMPFGLAIGAIPVLAFLTLDAVGLVYIPSNEKFQNHVDFQLLAEDAEKTSKKILSEIASRSRDNAAFNAIYRRYLQLNDRLVKLRAITKDEGHLFSRADYERVHNATLHYLRLCLSLLLIEERQQKYDPDNISRRIKTAIGQLNEATDPLERSRLQAALANYRSLETRHKKLEYRKTSIESVIYSLPDQIEEIYQMALLEPAQGGSFTALGESLLKLKTAEEVQTEIDNELTGIDQMSVDNSANFNYYGTPSNSLQKIGKIKTGE